MLIDFSKQNEVTIPAMNEGKGTMSAKMFFDQERKVIISKIHPDSSIGMYLHKSSDDYNYVLSGTGYAICDEKKEILKPGVCHLCKKGSSHSIVNSGNEDLVLLTIVVEK